MSACVKPMEIAPAHMAEFQRAVTKVGMRLSAAERDEMLRKITDAALRRPDREILAPFAWAMTQAKNARRGIWRDRGRAKRRECEPGEKCREATGSGNYVSRGGKRKAVTSADEAEDTVVEMLDLARETPSARLVRQFRDDALRRFRGERPGQRASLRVWRSAWEQPPVAMRRGPARSWSSRTAWVWHWCTTNPMGLRSFADGSPYVMTPCELTAMRLAIGAWPSPEPDAKTLWRIEHAAVRKAFSRLGLSTARSVTALTPPHGP